MGGRKKRRKIIRRKVRKLPKIFYCPRCGKQTVVVEFASSSGVRHAVVKCTSCDLSAEFEVKRFHEAVDAYNVFVDKYYMGEIG